MGIKDEDLAGLSDEELAALEDDDDETDILKTIAGAGSEDDDPDDGDDEDEDRDDDDPAAAGTGDDPAAAAATAGAAGAADDKAAIPNGDGVTDEEPTFADFQPEFKAVVPEGLAERLAEIGAKEGELLAQFQEGDIDLSAYIVETGKLNAEKVDLQVKQAQAAWAESQNKDSKEQRWEWEQQRFFGQDKAAIYKTDTIAFAAFNASVKSLANDPKNATRPDAWFLEEADRQVRARLNLGGAAPAAKAEDKTKARQPDLSNLPKTLSGVPAADLAETGADEFAYLDKLDGMDLEMALRKLTPEQEARYLGASA